MSTFVNRTKGSSHPVTPGGTYVGIVRSVLPSGFVTVYIPRLDTVYSPVEMFTSGPGQGPRIDDKVVCSFINNTSLDLVCHSFNARSSIFKEVQFTTTSAAEIDTFSVIEFAFITYEIVAKQSSGLFTASLRVSASSTSVSADFYGGSTTVDTFNGQVSASSSSVLNNVCSVKLSFSDANTSPTTVKFARSFCFPAL